MNEESKTRISRQMQKKLFWELNSDIKTKLDKMITNNEFESYVLLSGRSEQKQIKVSYLLFKGKQNVDKVIGLFNIKTGSISYSSSLSKSMHKKYLG